MKRAFRWILGVLLVVCGAGGVAAYRQRAEMKDLEVRHRQLGEGQALTPVELGPGPQTVTTVGLNTGEKIELMKLRSRVTELSEIKRRMARVAEENVALRGRASAMSNLATQTYPPGWVRRADAKSAGFGSPEAAFETFVWALEHRDTNALFHALIPEMHDSLIRQWQSAGPEEFWKVTSRIPGFRVTKVTPISEGEVQMEIDMVPGMSSPEVKASRTNGQWKIRM